MVDPTSRTINIKGIGDGLLMSLNSFIDLADLQKELDDELLVKREFLRGSRVAVEVGGRLVTKQTLEGWQQQFEKQDVDLWAVLSHREDTRQAARALGLATRLPGSTMDLEGNGRPEPIIERSHERDFIPANALLLKETLRGGRSVFYDGPVIIFGDVNPGSEVVATGDVIVWGKLRGLVHAGAAGNHQATVAALDLSPTQLRIADLITVPPQGKRADVTPEIAMIRGEQIVAEAWK